MALSQVVKYLLLAIGSVTVSIFLLIFHGQMLKASFERLGCRHGERSYGIDGRRIKNGKKRMV